MVKRTINFLTAMLMMFSFSLSAQQNKGTITGIVRDNNGYPLAGASVMIDSLALGVATGNNGYYHLRGLRNGKYTLRFSFTGYEPVTVSIVLVNEASADVIMSEATVIADEVIVRSSRAGSRTPVAHSTIGASDLRKSDMTRDMPFLLSLMPSVVETSDAGNGIGYTSLRIRGTDANRINVTIDGIPLNDAESQQVFWVDLPDLASSAGTIQVQRGVGTSTNGAGAFGASVNINTLSPDDDPGASVDLSAGSFNTFRATAKAWSGLTGDRFNMMIRASSIISDGYIRHSASDIRSAMITGIWSSSKDKIRFNVLTGRERTGISWWGVPAQVLPDDRRYNPAGEYLDADGVLRYYEDETDNYIQDHYNLLFTHKFSQRFILNTGFHLTNGKGFYEEQKSEQEPEEYGLEEIIAEGEVISSTDMVVRKWLDNNFYGAIWSLVFQGQIAEWSIGGGANRYDGDHFGNITWMEHPGTNWPGYVWYRNNGLKNEFNIYGKINARISGSISGFADLQFRSVGYALSGRDDDMRNLTQKHRYGFFNPKAGLFWNNGGGSDAYLSVAVAHREPTRSDFTDASGDAEVTPRPERLTDFEGGYTFRTADLSLGVNLYYMHYHDQLVPTGKISNTGYPVMTNVAVSYRTGIELTCSYRPSRIIGLKMNMTLSSSKIRNFRNYFFNYNTSDWSEEYTWSDLGNVDIAYSPGVVSSAEVQIDPLKNLGFRLTGKYIGKQYFDNTMSDDRSVDPYYFCNMTTEYTFSAGKMKEAAVRLAVNNFTDVLFGGNLYENNAYGGMWTEDGAEKTWSYFFPQAGINYMLGFSLTF